MTDTEVHRAVAAFEIEIPETKDTATDPKRPQDLNAPVSYKAMMAVCESTNKLFHWQQKQIAELQKDNAELRAEKATLRQEVETLKQAVSECTRYKGVYVDGREYRENSLVTRNGSMWLCLRHTSARPGSDPESWLLTVKGSR